MANELGDEKYNSSADKDSGCIIQEPPPKILHQALIVLCAIKTFSGSVTV
jgi:hypothetical protein